MNLFDLFAKISLDSSEYESGLQKAASTGESFAGKLKSGFATVGKAAAVGFSAAVTAVGALSTASLNAYSSYEQLAGGVETLFSEKLSLEEFAEEAGYTVDEIRDRYNELANAPNVVMENAANAFKTAGMSANDYMDTVTSFSATLLQSLSGDTAAAAEMADQAIIDMSDNANKMGTSMASIQYAYQGFAKGNYTMLDNLKLGYGGTQSEMVRLINDSGILNEKIEDINEVSFDQVIMAIHEIQNQMGITGTTAKEASTTIEGSVNSAKAAWTNLLVGMADENANLSDLTSKFVESAATVASNVLPRITQILSGIGEAVGQFAPVITEQLPAMIMQVLPGLIDSGTQLISALITGITQSVPQLLAQVPPIIAQLVGALMQIMPQIMSAGAQLIQMLAQGIESGLPDMVSRLPAIIEGFLGYITENLPSILEMGVEVINSLVNGILQAVPEMVARLPEIITAFTNFITTNLPTIVNAGVSILVNLATGIIQAIPQMVSQIPQIITAFTNAIATAIPQIIQAGVQMLTGLADGVIQNIPAIVAAVPQIIASFIGAFDAQRSGIINIGKNIVSGVWDGITGMIGWFTSKVTSFFSGIVGSVKKTLNIHSPSRVFADIGKNMALGVGVGWDGEYDGIKKDIDNGLNFSGSATLSASGGGYSSGAIGGGIGSVNITVNGAKYSNERQLAKAIAEEIQNMTSRKAAVYA